MLERQSLTTKVIGEETFLDIDVVGEIVKGDKLIDNFRYRFDFPASTVSVDMSERYCDWAKRNLEIVLRVEVVGDAPAQTSLVAHHIW